MSDTQRRADLAALLNESLGVETTLRMENERLDCTIDVLQQTRRELATLRAALKQAKEFLSCRPVADPITEWVDPQRFYIWAGDVDEWLNSEALKGE